jgi:ElaA protein
VAQGRFNASEVWLDAQLHAVGFYKALDFQTVSDVFMEAGIEHIRMMWKK